MNQADMLLDGLSESEIQAYTVNPANEGHIVIGSDRRITVPDELKRIAVQYDHNVETVTFDCPRYWDGIDMSEMVVYINYMLPNGRLGSYLADDVTVDEADESTMHFTWTISGEVTKVKGNITILVCIKNADPDEGIEINHWNSELNKDMYVSEGLTCTEPIFNEYPDIVTQLLVVADRANAIAATLEAHLESGDFELGLPIVDESDNGRILRVEDGEWCADELRVYEGGAISYIPKEALGDLGDISAALDSILAIQEELHGCFHDPKTDPATVIQYPSSLRDGIIEYTCAKCGEVYRENFTSLSRTTTFGGTDLVNSPSSHGYSVDSSGKTITRTKASASELNAILDCGIPFGANDEVPDRLDVTFEYDTSVWGYNAISFMRSKVDTVETSYFFRVINNNKSCLLFKSSDVNVASSDWLKSPNCPLVLAPVKVTLTYNWR